MKATFYGRPMPDDLHDAAARIDAGVAAPTDLQAFKAWLLATMLTARDVDLLHSGRHWVASKGYEL